MKNIFYRALLLMPTALVLSACLSTSLPGSATAEETSMDQVAMINVDHRDTTSLNGTWEVIIDRYERGFLGKNLEEIRVGSGGQFSYAGVAKDKSDKMEYGFENGETLEVPGDWNTQDDRLFFYEGTVWYKKNFDYDLKEGKRLFLYFGAANYKSIVYLNAEELGRHEGGFTPFSYEITDKLKPEGNTLVVLVDNTRKVNSVPTLKRDWWNYGGITRRVMLIEEEETFIKDYKVQLKKDSMNRIAGWVQLDGNKAQQNVTVRIPEAGAEFSVKTDADGYADFEFDAAGLDLWSPENPKLYNVQLTADSDTIEDRIGFRCIQVKGQDVLLNGESIFIRGISVHEEAPIRTGRAFSRGDAQTLLGWAKEMNCNFVRLAHYPHNEHMLRMADEMGLLVWSEIPLYWEIEWEDPKLVHNARKMLSQMIARDKNRASIILWSVANETRLSDARLNFLGNLANLAREQDPTRLITAALLAEKGYIDGDENFEGNILQVNINDPLGEYLDVIGCNQYQGWYTARDDLSVYNVMWKTPYNKPVVFSEFGAGAKQGFHADKWTVWSEEYQELVYEQQMKMIEKIPFIRGISPWVLMDFRSPRRMNPVIQDYYNRKGLISERGQKKKAFYVLQDFYERKKQEK